MVPWSFSPALLALFTVFLPATLPASSPDDHPTVLLVVGAAGEVDYGTNFLEQAQRWTRACEQAGARQRTIGLDPADAEQDLERLRIALDAEPKDGGDWWIVLIGHGTFDGRDSKFNLRGPDLTATNLADWLEPFRRRTAVINTASSSAPFLKALSASNRVVITATRSGSEQNYTRFGDRFAEAIADPATDLDQDGQTSLLEAFLAASFRVAEFYKSEGRLATEHALIDDNGDGLGTPADWFRGLRAVKRPRAGAALDGLRAHQMHLARSPAENLLSAEVRAKRDQLELRIAELREAKAGMPEADYYTRLETLLVELARLYPDPSTLSSPGTR